MDGLRLSVEEYIASIEALESSHDLEYLRQVVFFVFAQVSAVATTNGLEDWSAFNMKMGYYHGLDQASTKAEMLDLCKNFIIDFGIGVHKHKNKIESRYTPLIRQICRYIFEHQSERIKLDTLVGEFHFSEGYIAHRFKEEVGMSIGSYIMKVRIDEAKTMLNQHISIIEIANRLGFNSQSHFSRTFRAQTGKTPTEWMKTSFDEE